MTLLEKVERFGDLGELVAPVDLLSLVEFGLDLILDGLDRTLETV